MNIRIFPILPLKIGEVIKKQYFLKNVQNVQIKIEKLVLSSSKL